MFTNILPQAMTRLQLHDVVIYDRRRHRVDEVNDCRARLRPIGGSDFISISPESELETIGKWLPHEQRVKLFGEAGSRTPSGCVPAITFQTEPQPPQPESCGYTQTSFL
ncbi:MAG: hypothetical protein ACTHLW_14350 [Verrucomicrobiota bacterium]